MTPKEFLDIYDYYFVILGILEVFYEEIIIYPSVANIN